MKVTVCPTTAGAFTMEVISGVRGVDDRHGRVRVYMVMLIAYIAILMVIVYVITGDWRSTEGLIMGLVFGCISLCLGFCGLGLAEVVSCVFMYPVPSISRPFSSPRGRGVGRPDARSPSCICSA